MPRIYTTIVSQFGVERSGHKCEGAGSSQGILMMISEREFEGRSVFITGVASGIGLKSAEMFADAGARVGGFDLQAEVPATFSGDYYVGDVSDYKSAFKSVEEFVHKHGRLDTLILSAGINGPMGRIDDIHPDEFRRLFDVNVFGMVNFIHASAKHLEATGGSIMLLGSINGSRSFKWAGAAPYIASKAAVVALGRNLATEFGPRGIRINTICPGQTDTNIHSSIAWRGEGPVGRPVHYPDGSMPLTGRVSATTEDVVRAIMFLSSDMSKHITGTELFVDAGQSLI